MSVAIIIPARYASSRFPGKPLQELMGPDGAKPLIQHAWEAAQRVPNVDDVYVATDDAKIEVVAKDFGAQVIMTDPACRNGTERCAEAVSNANIKADIIVNLQGDAPLTPSWFVSSLIEKMQADQSISMATPVLKMDLKTLKQFKHDRSQGLVGGTTAVFDDKGRALYFSKEVIPYCDDKMMNSSLLPELYHHVGVYAYRPSVLRDYLSWPVSKLEALEGLEQLRFLAQGCAVQCVKVESEGKKFWELNNPCDIELVEAGLAEY